MVPDITGTQRPPMKVAVTVPSCFSACALSRLGRPISTPCGTAIAIAHSIPAGLSALIPGLQPILTSTLANRWLGERVTPLQWTGLLLGLAGVVLILHDRPMSGEAGWGWLASGMSLVSITLGTLYQRRYCGKIDWRAGNLVQYVAVAIFFGTGAWLFETNVVHWTGEF